ncbi:MAG: hypothetical protein ABIF85_03180 [Nanoarchaeota archaeon]|nr:hypothetical protein [Nanoarchaeota archaeon]MBU4300218.1 hypothetical protein [Nanoarchaeota archaeon]MBU4451604.1 hypothetical protein [Nanoarchaeota archaeon]MCG2723126.1 hypothetical protein [archaeon]
MKKITQISCVLQCATVNDLYDLSLKSAQSKEKKVFIYEKSDLSKIIGSEKAEELRKLFLKNEIKIKQITNVPIIPSFSRNVEFVNNCMFFRDLPKETFNIDNEILIFDDIVAVYNIEPKLKLTIIKDKSFAENQKQLFTNLWEQGQTPKLGFEYKPNHSFYNSINFAIQKKHIIVYPDKDALGMASGNTLLVLDYEEKLRRQSEDLKSYFNGPSPHLPLELLNGMDFL